MHNRSEIQGSHRVLLVEDEYLVAADLAQRLEEVGFEVVGPAGSVEDALELVRSEGARLDSAVLDINLGGEAVYPVADALVALGVRFVFVTGYDRVAIPPAYVGVPKCDKPVDRRVLMRCLLPPDPAESA